MIEVLEKPYINALRARGLKESQVIYRHALRNALIPVVASLGGFISQLIIGLFVVENFFTIHGLSSLLLQALDALRPLHLLGSVVFMTVILAVANLASDISYAIINPKIRLRYSGRSRKLRGAK
jgi:peptide/nickel transport system permease protein